MRPRIGITSWHHRDEEERWEAVLDAYTRAVLEVGGLPVILPIATAEPVLSRVEGPALIEEYLETIDGLIMTGGSDIHPSFYGQIVLERCGEIDEQRDRFEVELIHAARGRDLPFLGICRGLQVLNVALGGALYQDLSYRQGTDPAHMNSREQRGEPAHPVAAAPGFPPRRHYRHPRAARDQHPPPSHPRSRGRSRGERRCSRWSHRGDRRAGPLPPRGPVAPRANGRPPPRAARPVPISRRVGAAPRLVPSCHPRTTPFAASIPVRTANPFPLFLPGGIRRRNGHPVVRARTAAAVPSWLPSFTTMISEGPPRLSRHATMLEKIGAGAGLLIKRRDDNGKHLTPHPLPAHSFSAIAIRSSNGGDTSLIGSCQLSFRSF